MSSVDLVIVATIAAFVLMGLSFGAIRVLFHGLTRVLMSIFVGYVVSFLLVIYARSIYSAIASQLNAPRAMVEVIINLIIVVAIVTILYKILGRLKTLLIDTVHPSSVGLIFDRIIGIPVGALVGIIIVAWAYVGIYQPICQTQNMRCVESKFRQYLNPTFKPGSL